MCITAGLYIFAAAKGRCVSSCEGKPDGDYQSCNGCSVYASCVGGHLIDNRPCPPGLVWDDRFYKKECRYRSWTCFEREVEAEEKELTEKGKH